jgi:(S)-2-hydroxyglutarate dehydrogenase
MKNSKIIIIGGGIIGLATAFSLVKQGCKQVIVLEAENEISSHQTGNNSGVIHSGLYYKPNSLKAKNCIIGREMMYAFCKDQNIPVERCGKLVVATKERELPFLRNLEERGRKNGLEIKYVNKEEIKEYEPYVDGLAGLWVADTGIVDYRKVSQRLAELVEEMGGEIRVNTRLMNVKADSKKVILQTTRGELLTDFVVNCAGLQADRVAQFFGINPGIRIIPFRGEYYKLEQNKQYLVRNLIYPVPDPRFPFLGVHFTRMIGGGIEAGPNAVMAFKREGYRYRDTSLRDLWDSFSYIGLWRLGLKFWPIAVREYVRSLNKNVYTAALQHLIPSIEKKDIKRGGAGVRAQALLPNGKLVDDYLIIGGPKSLHVLNAPSPAATSSLSIGESLANRIANYTR